MLRLLRLCTVLTSSIVFLPSLASEIVAPSDTNLQTIRSILEKPDNQIDLVRTKLVIDHMIDASVNIDSTVKLLDGMANAIRTMLPPNPSSLEKMEVLVQYLYQGGAWNNNQPFRYDLDDPFGKKIKTKLLPTYLSTKKGNCVSMPILFILLGQKLGITVNVATAPEHLFVKYRLDNDSYRNFEATSGGQKLDSSYRRDIPMTDLAIKNGIYMRPLGKKETVAVLAEVLLEWYRQQNQPEQIIALSDLLLGYFPNDITAILSKGSAYSLILKRDFLKNYPTPRDIPQEQFARYNALADGNRLWFQKAEALGWLEPDAKSVNNYIQSVERAKATQ